MGKWCGEAEDGGDDCWTSGMDDGFEVSFSAEIAAEMGGSGGDGREAAKAATCHRWYGDVDQTKFDDALKRQHKAEAKFKALAQSTPANLTGLPSPLRPNWQDFPREAHCGVFRPQAQQLRLQGLISPAQPPVKPFVAKGVNAA